MLKHIDRYFILIAVFVFGVGAVCAADLETINKEIAAGNFASARTLIDQYITTEKPPLDVVWDLRFQKERFDRIEYDFRGKKEQVLEYIKRYYPDLTDEQIAGWKKDKSLEVMTIDGQERYFRGAASNFFLINKEARAKRLAANGPKSDSLNDCLKEHFPAIVAAAKKTDLSTNLEPKKMIVTYTLTIPANVVPAGEMIRCWLPYPRSDQRRQSEITLIKTNLENPVFSPQGYKHCTVYSEKVAVKDQPTVFEIQFYYRATGEWFDFNKLEIKPYDKESPLYKEYTAERKTHIIFTDEIKELSKKIVGDEKEPRKIVKKIYDGITTTYPWASAREYSTVPNIPAYVIENGHGDCGMVSLLLTTLCRYNGVPAKWQSGFMVHPDSANMHDWAEVYYEGIGWVPIDPSIGARKIFDTQELNDFLSCGIDSYRWVINEDYSQPLYPTKIYPRSETVDFQRGEVEWRCGNLYFNQWGWDIDVTYVD